MDRGPFLWLRNFNCYNICNVIPVNIYCCLLTLNIDPGNVPFLLIQLKYPDYSRPQITFGEVTSRPKRKDHL